MNMLRTPQVGRQYSALTSSRQSSRQKFPVGGKIKWIAVPKQIPEKQLLHLNDRAKWRAWLKRNYKTKQDVWLVYAKKHTGKPRIAYNDAVEEALCFGWIDSTVKTIDQDNVAQRFSVRKPKSTYSQTNIERLRALVQDGKIMDDVLGTLPDLSEENFKIASDILEAIKSDKDAWSHFQAFSAPYIRIPYRLYRGGALLTG